MVRQRNATSPQLPTLLAPSEEEIFPLKRGEDEGKTNKTTKNEEKNEVKLPLK